MLTCPCIDLIYLYGVLVCPSLLFCSGSTAFWSHKHRWSLPDFAGNCWHCWCQACAFCRDTTATDSQEVAQLPSDAAGRVLWLPSPWGQLWEESGFSLCLNAMHYFGDMVIFSFCSVIVLKLASELIFLLDDMTSYVSASTCIICMAWPKACVLCREKWLTRFLKLYGRSITFDGRCS